MQMLVLPAMASHEQKVAEHVRGIQQFLATQKGLLDKSKWGDLVQKQCESIVERIGSHSMSIDGMNALLELTASGPWNDSQRESISEALSEQACKLPAGRRRSRPNQTCKSFTGYFSEQDVRAMKSDAHGWGEKLDRLAARCVRVGLHLPSEQTVKEILRASQQMGLKLGDDRQTRYEAVNAFKKSLRHRVRNAEKHPVHVVDFPANPKDLDGWQQMYDEEDPPCGQTDLPRHHSAQYSVPLRQLKEAQPKAAAASQGQWGTPMEMMQSMMQVMMGNAPQQRSANLPGFKMLGGGGGGGDRGRQALMLGDRGTDSQEPETPSATAKAKAEAPAEKTPPSATAKAKAEAPAEKTPPSATAKAKAEAPAEKAPKTCRPAEKAPKDDCVDVPAAEADAEEFLKARQKRESTKSTKALKRPACSDGYVKEWRSKHHKQVIKCGRQLCQFGDLALTREQLTEIADDAIEKMRKGTLQQDACKAWCDSAVKAALKK